MKKKMLMTFAMMMCLAMPITANAATVTDDTAVVTEAVTPDVTVQAEQSEDVSQVKAAEFVPAEGWHKNETDGNWYYGIKAEDAAGYSWAKSIAITMGTKTYYFDGNGVMITGKTVLEAIAADSEISGSEALKAGTYYFTESAEGDDAPGTNKMFGTMVKDKWVDDVKYGADGAMIFSDWTTDEEGKDVYVKEDGTVVTNEWKAKGDRIVFLDEIGHIKIMPGKQKTMNGIYYFFNDDGTYVTSQWKNDNYFEADGKMAVSKWVEKDGKMVYVNADGAIEVQTGFQTIDGGIYYFYSDGTYAKNKWIIEKNIWYYAGSDGKMLTGLQKIGSSYFYMDKTTGAMKDYGWNGWNLCDGHWYIMQRGGYIRTSQWYWDSSYKSWYYLNSDGKMATNQWVSSSGKWYWLRVDGTLASKQWVKDGSHWYHIGNNGVMQTGWFKEGSRWYFLNSNGMMAEGWVHAGGVWYYMQPGSGYMATGWVKMGNAWYFFKNNGAMATGWQYISGAWYYMNNSGLMMTGWVNQGGNWYFMTGSGAMKTGWLWNGGAWYYLRSNGIMVANTTETIDGTLYAFNASGAWVKLEAGWQYINGYKMYVNSSGGVVQDVSSMLTSAQKNAGYYITVNRSTCVVTIYAKDLSKGTYTVPVKALRCSVGLASLGQTPVGTFTLGTHYRWKELMGPSWGQYATHVVNGVYFHSVAGSNTTSYNLSAAQYNRLGSPASHGCIRLNVRDAKWIYDNCAAGTTVRIGDSVAQPLSKPAGITIPSWQNWDPTDPNV